MLKFVKSSVAAAALLGLGFMSPAMAQSASEMAVRMQLLEEQVRQLTGQVEELSFQIKQLRGAPAPQQSGAAEPLKPAATIAALPQPEQPQPTQQKRLAAASAGAPIPDSNGIETIEQAPIAAPAPAPAAPLPPAADAQQQQLPGVAPTVKVFGALDSAAAQPDDGGFQGQVLVPPSQQDAGDDYVQQGTVATPPPGSDDSIETVSLQPGAATQTDTPESLYERSNESLLRRQFGEAEAGFSSFIQKYPDHSLAGSAQYWLGETYYAQNDYKRAAANFLQGYKKYPTSRRAPDSLLKLGISLNRLGQGEQACAAFAAVSTEYPKAVDARKRAQAEAKRAGCAS